MSSSTHAFDAFDGAVERTQSLLRPLDFGIWMRLAVVALCAGGFGGLSLNIISLLALEKLAGTGITSSSGYLAILGIFLAVLLVIRCIGAVFQFVLVDGLTVGPVTLFWTFDVRARKGLRLFLFEALIGGALLGLGALFLTSYDFSLSLESIPVLFSASPLLLLSVLLLWFVMIVTIDLVVPVMIADDCGVLAGWRTVLGLGAADLRNTLAYLLTRTVLAVAADLAVIVLILIAMFFIFLIAPGIFAIPLVLLAAFLIPVPFLGFFRYYGLLVLGYFSPARDLLTPRRG
ncbi:hypothetical protein RJ40_00105 [Methanofollis aquaemaris]|uniref:Uncharacterized protein n=1 Tax=Methanofollis aquaemaris TaxID=126734 RepID=A0A8A3S0L0_9EURY|nr:hypothetical protein [Methanofollis aquaemaris]QSZ66015.1 hypothetical protein RJ40_00105 [Methanofollis aquaemaris]